MSKNQRSFRIIAVQDGNIKFKDGLYHGKRPGQAAGKAFSWFCRKSNLNMCVRRFTIEEVTRGKPHKQFHYVGTRKQLQPPREIERDGNKYFVHYESKVLKAS